ncbi:MAG: hypothetical protein ACK56N_15780 [Betaproteobacteria bacterium]
MGILAELVVSCCLFPARSAIQIPQGEHIMRFNTVAVAAVAAMLPSIAAASPWTTLGRLDALAAPPLASCNQRLVNHYSSAKPVHVPIAVTYATNGSARLTFAGDYATLRLFAAGDSAFASAVTTLTQTTSLPGPVPVPPAGYRLVVVNGQPLFVALPPAGATLDSTNPLRAFGPVPAGFMIDPANPAMAFRILPNGQREVVMRPMFMLPTLAVPPAQPVPVVAKDMSAVVQTGLNASVAINVGLMQPSGAVETRSFAINRTALRYFELQQSCPL